MVGQRASSLANCSMCGRGWSLLQPGSAYSDFPNPDDRGRRLMITVAEELLPEAVIPRAVYTPADLERKFP
jgi:hypothetical protein